MFEISLSLVSLFGNTWLREEICRPQPKLKKTRMARYEAESVTFQGVICDKNTIWGGCFGSWKIQSGPSVFHIGLLHGLIRPRCKGQFSPKFWYQDSPISIGLNWPRKQYRSGLTRFGPIGSFHFTVCFLTTCLRATLFWMLTLSAFLYISKMARQNSF